VTAGVKGLGGGGGGFGVRSCGVFQFFINSIDDT
jgi:hypothetical protein